jgi:YidC/Oxa1 family membrane protein insertase
VIGNIGLSVLAMTILVRAATFPLTSKSFRSMAKMKEVTPKLRELQEKYKDDKVKFQTAVHELYSKEDVNPFSGCWPILVQIPIFFALYKTILVSVDLRHAPFWGWVSDLSAPDPTNLFTLFGLIPWEPPSLLSIGAWPCLFCISMVMQRRLSPPLPDKTQEQFQAIFPYFITVMMAHFSVGLVIYWTWSNVLGMLQQYYIQRQMGAEDVSLLRGHHARRKKKKDGK